MNISLLISGNLTGFGRFYTSPAAKELLGNERIDLDNHNHLTFLEKDEKAYSITFAKRYIAISQYTQILDSFRRPGKLVVSVLVPRSYMIVPNSGLPKGAVYSLLTKISDKFYEKNFQDGMINQNPAVLGQDYYSEILNGYSLAPSDNRRINEDPSPVKKIGYVRASELDMPSYLDTPYRKSYGEGGYNLVFFAPSAPVGTPNSIDEEPTEVVLYRVRILNTGAILPNPVKLSAPLYKLQAKAGEKAFPIEGTYKDAVDHLLEPRITARIQSGEIVEVLYNFEKDEKTIKFVFVDMATGTPVSLDSVLPSISFADGSRQPISSETFTFRGSEIYDDKKLVADKPEISISPRSERLDLSRLSDNQELKVYVQQVFNLSVELNYTKLTITFVNKNTGEKKPFSNQKMIHLPGNITDWNVYVDTDNYVAPIQAIAVQNGKLYIQGLQQRDKNVSKKAVAKMKPMSTDVAVQTKTPVLPHVNLSDGQDANNSPKRKIVNWHKYLLLIPIICILAAGGYWLYKSISGQESNEDGYFRGKNGEPSELGCYFVYFDSTDDINKRDTLSNKNYFNFRFNIVDGNDEVLNLHLEEKWLYGNPDHKELLLHKLTLNDETKDNESLFIRVSYVVEENNALQLVEQEISKSSLQNFDTISVNLGILLSQLGWYKVIADQKEFESQQRKDKWIDNIRLLNPSKFQESLMALAENKPVKSVNPGGGKPTITPESPEATPIPTMQKTERIPELLTGNSWLTAADLKKKYPQKNTARNVYNRAQAMAKALDMVNSLKKASPDGLDKVQQKTIQKYNVALETGNENLKKILEDAKSRNQLTSFSQLWGVVQDF